MACATVRPLPAQSHGGWGGARGHAPQRAWHAAAPARAGGRQAARLHARGRVPKCLATLRSAALAVAAALCTRSRDALARPRRRPLTIDACGVRLHAARDGGMGAYSLTAKAFLVVCVAHCVARVARIPPVHWGVHKTPLYQAVERGDLKRVQQLLSAHAHADAGFTVGPFGVLASETPLLQAANNSDAAIVEALLKAGATVDAGATIGPFGVLASWTPLGTLLDRADAVPVAIVTALVEAGAAVNARGTMGPFGMLGSLSPLPRPPKVTRTS
jgi:hypothetical protein